MNYSPELKEAILRRMLPPNNESIQKIAKQEGIAGNGAMPLSYLSNPCSGERVFDYIWS